MPKGPRGEKRPADVVSAAVMVGRIATGEIEDQLKVRNPDSARKGGLKGGAARAAALDPATRSNIAKKAAEKRWQRKRTEKAKDWASMGGCGKSSRYAEPLFDVFDYAWGDMFVIRNVG
jgi:hypothetical protein